MIDKIKRMEEYAIEHHIPIMESDGIALLKTLVEENHFCCILEIGTAIGYSAIQMASVDASVHVTTLERDEARHTKALENVEDCGLGAQVDCILTDALTWISEESYDLIFIDAAKGQYQVFFDRYAPLLAVGGMIVCDNMQFHGMLEETAAVPRRLKTMIKRLREFHTYLKSHKAFDLRLLHIGDGVALLRRKPHIKAVIFDMDGLMLDTERIARMTWMQVFHNLQITVDEDFYASVIGCNYTSNLEKWNATYAQYLSFDDFRALIAIETEGYFKEHGIPVKPGLYELLEYLDASDIPYAVATSTRREAAMKNLQTLGLWHRFRVHVCGDEVTHGKPHPEVFLTAASKLGVDVSNAIVLEDSRQGAEGGWRGGFAVGMVPDLLEPTAANERQVQRIFASLHEVLDYIKG